MNHHQGRCPRIGNKWTPEEEQLLIERVRRQEGVQNIALHHERTVKAIEMRIEHLIRKLSKGGMKTHDLCETFHKSPNDIQNILSSEPNPPSSSFPMKEDTQERLDKIEQRLEKIERLLEKIHHRIKKNMTSSS